MDSLTTHPALPVSTRAPAHPWLDRVAYPFASHTFASPDGSMHYVDEGPARDPILFVHGTPSWSFEWRHAISGLRTHRRCIAVDHLGFGLSDKPTLAPYKPIDHARRLLDFVRQRDLRDLTLVLHDFGGPIGLPVLLQEPERVRALVLVNTWAWSHGQDARLQRISKFVASPLGRFLYTWLNASPRWLVPASFGDRACLTPSTHAHYLAPFAHRAERTAPWVLGCELTGSDDYYDSLWSQRDQLARVPSAIVWGTRDPAFGPAYLQRWRDTLPNAVVIEVEGAGHFPQEEAPERLLEVLSRL